ncbi:hypothetical protein L596_015560 [Steinernema carpocapsae]|uniref:Uncharacterized protein n=1 Tax=Steinernema carpocapsae TaxID=34508 RepID=A0A4V6A398_STECR|nr:hypothetical protein L596_015560 [Steinernema carpocapsae]
MLWSVPRRQLAILATESVFLLPYKTLLICYGSVKSFSVIRAITGVYKEKYSYLWPFVVVKIIETVLSFLVAVLIATLLFYPISVNNRLVYQISPDQNHSILTILLLISFLSFSTNALFLRIILKCQRYIRRKSLTEYLLLRRHIFHSFLKH